MRYVHFTLHDLPGKGVLAVAETALRSLRAVSDATPVVATDNVPQDIRRRWSMDYGVHWRSVPSMAGRRALSKLRDLEAFVDGLEDSDEVCVSDVDVYFLGDPFEAFDIPFDVAVTSRFYAYYVPINGGVFFLRVNDRTRRWCRDQAANGQRPTWSRYVFLRQCLARKYDPDWTVGQDWLNASWRWRDELKKEYGLEVVDVGARYNFCPGTDIFGIPRAAQMIRRAHDQRSVAILHLKSELKNAILDDWLEHAVKPSRLDGWEVNWPRVRQ